MKSQDPCAPMNGTIDHWETVMPSEMQCSLALQIFQQSLPLLEILRECFTCRESAGSSTSPMHPLQVAIQQMLRFAFCNPGPALPKVRFSQRRAGSPTRSW